MWSEPTRPHGIVAQFFVGVMARPHQSGDLRRKLVRIPEQRGRGLSLLGVCAALKRVLDLPSVCLVLVTHGQLLHPAGGSADSEYPQESSSPLRPCSIARLTAAAALCDCPTSRGWVHCEH